MVRATTVTARTAAAAQNANMRMLACVQAAIASPGGGHGPVIGERWPEFAKATLVFLTA